MCSTAHECSGVRSLEIISPDKNTEEGVAGGRHPLEA